MKRRNWKKRLVIWLLLAVLLLPFAAFGLSNLFLISPKGRDYLSSQITARIQLESSVQGSTWSPWNGITIYGLQVEQPEQLRDAIPRPLLTIQSIRVLPGWKQLLKKRVDLRSVELVGPDLTIPIELLAAIPTTTPPAADLAAAHPPDLAMKQPTIPSTPASPSVIPAPAEPGPAPPRPPKAQKTTPPETTAPTRLLQLTDARVRIVTTMSDSTLYQLKGLTGQIPYSGKNAKTKLHTGTILALGKQISGKMEIPIDWNTHTLSAGPIHGKAFGLDATASVQLSLTRGFPLRAALSVPEQRDREIRLSDTTGMKVEAVSGKALFQGFLIAPASWQGEALFRSTEIDARHLGNETHFDSGHALFLFRNGTLTCADARLSGEEVSILTNGSLLSDGRAAANVRIVGSPGTLGAISKYTDPTGSPPYYTPLHTPQRAALDLELYGRLGDFFYKPNPKAEPIPLR